MTNTKPRLNPFYPSDEISFRSADETDMENVNSSIINDTVRLAGIAVYKMLPFGVGCVSPGSVKFVLFVMVRQAD